METNTILGVQVNSRTKVYVSFEEDTFPNKGGYFCEVWLDPNKEFKPRYNYDFTIDRQYLRSSGDRLRLAKSLATERVKQMFKR